MSAGGAALQIHCPSCGASDVRESHSHNFADSILGLFKLVPYRCRACRNRFHRRVRGDEGELEATDQPAGKSPRGKDSG